jgi:predicted RNA-binding protein with PIN domain
MASIIIDGYNLIGVLHGDVEAERQRLLEMLMEYRKLKGHDITVVFDGWKEGRAQGSGAVTGGIRVVYSPLGEKADAVIKRAVSESRGNLIVVSSDREIQGHAWARGAVPVDSEVFMGKLEHAGRPEEPGPEGEDEEDYAAGETGRRGNPRRPSKRQKALRRALSKL